MKIHRQETAENKASQIDYEKDKTTEYFLHKLTKWIQGNHIESQMKNVDMQKSRGKHAEPLSGTDFTDVQFVFPEKIFVVKAFKAYQNVGQYNGD